MIQKLPVFGFAWEKVADFIPVKIDKMVKTGKKRYLLEVDVEYLKSCTRIITSCHFNRERISIGKVEKLVPNYKDKKTYVVHIKNLDQELKHTLKLKKVHKIFRFEQTY